MSDLVGTEIVGFSHAHAHISMCNHANINTNKQNLNKKYIQMASLTLPIVSRVFLISEILENRLQRINYDIQRVYEELYETQERLTALRV